ncbi:MAG: Tir chaperone family protein [Myxococcales bacterium]|nr:Tir chaperone family protein [Myxococcales bacterium]
MADSSDLDRFNDYLARFARLSGVAVAPLDGEGYTQVVRGSATIGINVLFEKGFILLLSPMMAAPARNQAELYRTLLELNYLRTEDAAFAIDRETGRVYLRALRSLDLLDFDQLCELLDTVARVADEWDDKLRCQFGAA